jgi:hypothetical protein
MAAGALRRFTIDPPAAPPLKSWRTGSARVASTVTARVTAHSQNSGKVLDLLFVSFGYSVLGLVKTSWPPLSPSL